ncbi:MAG: hypothetical protein II932_06495, partial [Treponema sp.]|nr:hypothetical protein [Treponema sp.]
LKNDNDALRTKCAELTKALDEKTELVSSLEDNQGKIEEGILTALNRLDTVENAILGGTAEGAFPAAGNNVGEADGSAAASSGDEAVEEDDTAAFDYTGGMAAEESPELKEVASEIADATNSSQDVQMHETAPAEGAADAPAADAPADGVAADAAQPQQAQDAESLNGQFDIF